MFSSGPNYTKLKTNLRLAQNRLKLLEKKKTELAQKARKEIADYIAAGKTERARIRVEHIIREDYLVEAMEIVEMYCDLLLARFGLVTQLKELDDGISEAVASIIWVAPRLQADVQELKVVTDLFTMKYGKPFADAARAAVGEHKVSEKLMHKLAIQAPPKLLVENYLIEIAKNFNVEYEPDPLVMQMGREQSTDSVGGSGMLIDLSDRNNLNGPQPLGFIGYPQAPSLPQMPMPPATMPFNYPSGPAGGGSGGGFAPQAPFNYNIPPSNFPSQSNEKKDLNVNQNFLNEEKEVHLPPPSYHSTMMNSVSPDDNLQNSSKPKPQPRKLGNNLGGENAGAGTPPMNFPDLPSVPGDLPDLPQAPKEDDDDIDFDDLTKRFNDLKKKK